MERLKTSNVSVCNGSIKGAIRKSTFSEKLLFNTFRTTVANADPWIQKSLNTLFDMYLNHMLSKLEPNRMVQSAQHFDLSHIWQDISVKETMVNDKLKW